MNWIVYLTTNKENGKLYIGVHKTANPNEFDGYIGNGIKVGNTLKNPKTIFQKALKKYGYQAFIRTTLFVYDNPEDAYTKEAELVTPEFIKKDNNYNMTEGGLHGNIKCKPVYQYTLKGELVKIWELGQVSIIDELGYGKNELIWALTQKVELHQHYWSLIPITDFSDFKKRKEYYLYKFDLKGNLVEVFENIAEASKILNINYNSLKSIIQNKYKYMDHYWTTNVDSIDEIIKINKLFNTKRKYINLYDLNGNFLQEFSSTKELCNFLGVCKQTISRAALQNLTVLDKYKVKYLQIKNLESIPILQIDYNTGEVVKEWPSIKECKKEHPKCKDVLRGSRNQTHGYTFKLKYDQIEDIV